MALDQPTAEQALKELEVLVGEWRQEATPPGGEPAFARFIQQEHDRWSKVIKSRNISLD